MPLLQAMGYPSRVMTRIKLGVVFYSVCAAVLDVVAEESASVVCLARRDF